MVGNEETRVEKERSLTLKSARRISVKPTNVFVLNTKYFIPGFAQNLRQDMKLVVTGSSLHICCRFTSG